ncbi:MAG TPA: aspartate carbamoyltransferase, partial [Patescibacteria group bacterium]|nr:aspartate carbamoyltransferase [Patescibacteria group bacterium]
KERFAEYEEYLKYKGNYKIDKKLAQKMRPKAIIMHPLPRVDEILPEVDALSSAVYFKQVQYGLLIRMALLKYIFSNA